MWDEAALVLLLEAREVACDRSGSDGVPSGSRLDGSRAMVPLCFWRRVCAGIWFTVDYSRKRAHAAAALIEQAAA